jgi:hypothetical protein
MFKISLETGDKEQAIAGPVAGPISPGDRHVSFGEPLSVEIVPPVTEYRQPKISELKRREGQGRGPSRLLRPAPGSKAARLESQEETGRPTEKRLFIGVRNLSGVTSIKYIRRSSCIRAETSTGWEPSVDPTPPPHLSTVLRPGSHSPSSRSTKDTATASDTERDSLDLEGPAKRRPKGYRDSDIEWDKPFLVIGIFSGSDRVPRERIVRIQRPERLFWQLWLHIITLRGLRFIFSLKDVKQFKIYKCNWEDEFHEHVEAGAEDENTLSALHWAYASWSPTDKEDWAAWIHRSLNSDYYDPTDCPISGAYSLQAVLGWSQFRISLVILGPVALSLVLGFWFQSRDPTDLATIQTAWGIASYVATAGGLVAALLAVLSSIGDK